MSENTHETDLIKRAVSEINALRHENRQMASRLDMFDKMMSLFQTTPNQPSQGYGLDIVWELNKHIEANENQQ